MFFSILKELVFPLAVSFTGMAFCSHYARYFARARMRELWSKEIGSGGRAIRYGIYSKLFKAWFWLWLIVTIITWILAMLRLSGFDTIQF